MAKDTIALKLDGNVSLADFSTVVDAFSQLIATLTQETNPDVSIDWNITEMEAGSATIISRGFFGANQEAMHTVDAVVEKYEHLGRDAERGNLEGYSIFVRERMEQLTSVVNGRIPRVRMGVSKNDWIATIERRLSDETQEVGFKISDLPILRTSARSAIRGQIVTADDKQAVYFTLAEAHTRRFIRCYPGAQWREKIGTFWTTKEYIIVEGTFSRYSNKPTLTNITDIVGMGDVDPDGWREAIGCVPREPDALNLTAAEAVRRVRDAES